MIKQPKDKHPNRYQQRGGGGAKQQILDGEMKPVPWRNVNLLSMAKRKAVGRFPITPCGDQAANRTYDCRKDQERRHKSTLAIPVNPPATAPKTAWKFKAKEGPRKNCNSWNNQRTNYASPCCTTAPANATPKVACRMKVGIAIERKTSGSRRHHIMINAPKTPPEIAVPTQTLSQKEDHSPNWSPLVTLSVHLDSFLPQVSSRRKVRMIAGGIGYDDVLCRRSHADGAIRCRFLRRPFMSDVTMPNPYQSDPQPITPPYAPLGPQSKPQVCLWYNLYCVCFTLLYILTAIGGLALAIFATEIAEASGEPDKQAAATGNLAAGIVMTVISIPLIILFIVGLMIPRKKWDGVSVLFHCHRTNQPMLLASFLATDAVLAQSGYKALVQCRVATKAKATMRKQVFKVLSERVSAFPFSLTSNPLHEWLRWVPWVIAYSVAALGIGFATGIYSVQLLDFAKFWFLPLTLLLFPSIRRILLSWLDPST